MKCIIPVFAILILLPSAAIAQSCYTSADQQPCDGTVTLSELTNYIDLWFVSVSSAPDLYDAINAYYNPPQQCQPSCSGKQCGDDGCGGSCGMCDDGYVCNVNMVCEEIGNAYFVSVSGGSSPHDGSAGHEFNLNEAISYSVSHPDEEVTFILDGGSYGSFNFNTERSAWQTWKAMQGKSVIFSNIRLGDDYNDPWKNTYSSFEDIEVYGSGINIDKASHNHFIRMEIHGSVTEPYTTQRNHCNRYQSSTGISVNAYVDFLVRDSEIYDVSTHGVLISNSDSSVINCKIHSIGEDAVRLWGDSKHRSGDKYNWLVDSNHIYDVGDCHCDENAPYECGETPHPDAMQMYIGFDYSIHNLTITNNLIHDCYAQGIFLSPGFSWPTYRLYDVTIQRNTIYGMGMSCINIGRIDGLTIDHNTACTTSISTAYNVVGHDNIGTYNFNYKDTAEVDRWDHIIVNGWMSARGADACKGPVAFADTEDEYKWPLSNQPEGNCNPCGTASDGGDIGAKPCAGNEVLCSNNQECDDGLYCNGQETCQSGECQDSDGPCQSGYICNEVTDTCISMGECVISSTTQNIPIDEQSGTFFIEYNATPYSDEIDAIIALSDGVGSTYSDYAVLVRFGRDGKVDARNGGVYSSDMDFYYASGTEYEFFIDVDVPNKIYDVYVDNIQIANDYGFRTEQAGISSIDNIGIIGDGQYPDRTIMVCDISLDGSSPPPQSYCGDGNCDQDEDCSSCQADCGSCPPTQFCGDGTCDPGEDCNSCETDCGSCPPGGIPNDYVSYWRFEGNLNDQSGNNHGTMYGTGTYITGVSGQGMDIASGSYVDYGNGASLNMQDSVTISMWVMAFSQHAYNVPMGKHQKWPTGTGYLFMQSTWPPKWQFRVSGITVPDSANIAFDEWIHIAGVYDGSSVKFYRNGQLTGSEPYSGLIGTNTKSFKIGTGNSDNPNRLYVDEALVYDRALSSTEIQQIYDAQK